MTEPLQTIINEFKTIDPDITNTVVFRMDGKTLAACENTTPEQTQSLIDSINRITHADSIGGIESLTVQDINTQLSLTAVDNVYLATLSSREADQKVIKSLAQVVVPTVIRLTLDKPVKSQKKRKQQPKTITPEAEVEAPVLPVLPPEQEPEVKLLPEPETPPEPLLPKAPTSQFMVEKIGGILVPPDIVRIDSEVVEKWQELYGENDFSMVSIDNLQGKTVKCKVKPKYLPKGMIQIPDRILQALQVNEGNLVMVKPVIE